MKVNITTDASFNQFLDIFYKIENMKDKVMFMYEHREYIKLYQVGIVFYCEWKLELSPGVNPGINLYDNRPVNHYYLNYINEKSKELQVEINKETIYSKNRYYKTLYLQIVQSNYSYVYCDSSRFPSYDNDTVDFSKLNPEFIYDLLEFGFKMDGKVDESKFFITVDVKPSLMKELVACNMLDFKYRTTGFDITSPSHGDLKDIEAFFRKNNHFVTGEPKYKYHDIFLYSEMPYGSMLGNCMASGSLYKLQSSYFVADGLNTDLSLYSSLKELSSRVRDHVNYQISTLKGLSHEK